MSGEAAIVSGEAAIVSGEAAIEKVANEQRKNKKT